MFLIKEKEQRSEDNALYEVLDIIKIEDLSNFTTACLNTFGSEEKLITANKVGKILMQMMRKKNLVNEQVQQSFVDVLISATLLHNLFYEPEDFTTLFKARKELNAFAKEYSKNNEYDFPQSILDGIFLSIEAQLGDSTPIPSCRPAPNSPTEMMAWACWFVKECQT